MSTTPQTIFIATAAFLFLKMQSNSFVQAYSRFRGAGFKYPEDSIFGDRGVDEAQVQRMDDLEYRATACWRNDLENIPFFIVAALCGLMAGIPTAAYQALMIGYCAARSLHSITLLFGKQPWRTIFFVIGTSITCTLFLWSLKLQGWT